ncbi:MAG: N-acetyltransferase, partial [Promethearchaeota archaeon]
DLCPEVVKLFLRYCFEELNLNKVSAEIFNINERSYRCAEKAGMKLEGKLKDDAYIDGKYYDSLCYSILEREWKGEF